MNKAETIPPRYTYEEYKTWEGDWELIQGYPYAMSPSPIPLHQITGKDLIVLLTEALRAQKGACNCQVLYDCDLFISNDTVLRPDIMVLCGNFSKHEIITATPALVIEIFSVSTKLKDRNTKFHIYESIGVSYYLMVDAERKKIEYFQLANNSFKEIPNIQNFNLTADCSITADLNKIFDL